MKDELGLSADENFVFHTCRHTSATRLLDAGVNILVIEEWLGHTRTETTQRYTHVKAKNLEAALAAAGEKKRQKTVGGGGRTWARTKDPLIKSQLLYQLSYASMTWPV